MKNTIATNDIHYEVYKVENSYVLWSGFDRLKAYENADIFREYETAEIGIKKITVTREVEILE